MEHVEPRRAEGMQKADVYFWSEANGFTKWDDVEYHADVNERSIDISTTKGKDFLSLKEAVVTVNANFGIRIGTAGLLWAVIDGRMADHGHFVLVGANDSGKISEFQSKGVFSITSNKGHSSLKLKLHVIAPNRGMFNDYLRMASKDERQVIYVHGAEMLRGLPHDVPLAFYGAYHARQDWPELLEQLRAMGRSYEETVGRGA
jgi:hypothetical protein